MVKYSYLAKTSPETVVQGQVEAESVQDAVSKLDKMGYFPLSVENREAVLDKQNITYFWKSPKKELPLFTRQLASQVEFGVNILKSFTIIQSQVSDKYLKAIINDLITKIKDGKSLSESLSLHPEFFSGFYISLVHSGEVGGNIEVALKRLADYLEKEEEFKNSIRGALVYPSFILVVSVVTVIILLGFVIPRQITMFADMGQMLPLPTKILISSSDFLRSFGWMILVAVFVFIFLLRRFYLTVQGKISIDNLKLKTFLLGQVILKTEISRLARTLSLLLSSGVPITQSLEISKAVLDNEILKLEIKKLKDGVAGGLSLSKCLQGSKLFPQFVTSMVATAEESGSIDRSLLRVADEYEKEVDRTLKLLIRLLEPCIILVMGCIVGFIVISMLLPIFEINLIVR
jgi:type II secretory pathway component PulF